MALNTQLTDLLVNAQAELMGTLLDGGFIDILTGPQPTKGGAPIESQTVLVTLGLSDPAFGGPAMGIIRTVSVNPGVAVADGDPVWFRAYRADHETPVIDGSAGREKANLILPVKTIVRGMTIGCDGFAHSVVKSLTGI